MTDFLTQLRRKHELLIKVLELTEAQAGLISADETDALLANISKRQNLIDELDAIQAELPDREILSKNSECMTLITEVNGVLKKIQERDAKNEQAALARMEDLRGRMRKANEGRKAVSGYDTGASSELMSGIYVDKGK